MGEFHGASYHREDAGFPFDLACIPIQSLV